MINSLDMNQICSVKIKAVRNCLLVLSLSHFVLMAKLSMQQLILCLSFANLTFGTVFPINIKRIIPVAHIKWRQQALEKQSLSSILRTSLQTSPYLILFIFLTDKHKYYTCCTHRMETVGSKETVTLKYPKNSSVDFPISDIVDISKICDNTSNAVFNIVQNLSVELRSRDRCKKEC